MNFGKWIIVLTGSIYLRDYLRIEENYSIVNFGKNLTMYTLYMVKKIIFNFKIIWF